ncbi:MAG: hypothetical protein EOO19_12990, partial [Chryseobacterium sp.]
MPYLNLSEFTTIKVSSKDYQTQQINLTEYNQNMTIGLYNSNHLSYLQEDNVMMKNKLAVKRAVPQMAGGQYKRENLKIDQEMQNVPGENLKKKLIEKNIEAHPIINLKEEKIEEKRVEEVFIIDRRANGSID